MDRLTWDQVLAWRMRRQHLERPADMPAVEIARRLAGVQAQVASSAELAVALRQDPPRPGEVGRALWDDAALIKTWAMRGTLHLLPADEVAAYLVLAGAVRHWEKPSWQKVFKATPADLEAIAAAAGEALAGGVLLTREELTNEIVERTGSGHLADVLGSGWGTVLKPLAWWGVLCFGPSRGTRVTFAAPDGRVPGWRGLPPIEDAARTVIRAFLGAHGPATPEAFDAWLSRGMNRKRDVRGWFAGLLDELATVEVAGTPMYVLAEHAAELAGTSPTASVRLAGGFDQYVLGAGTSATYLIPPGHRPEVTRSGGWISPVVLHAGRVVGTWDPADGEIGITLWDDHAREIPQDALEAERTRLATLLTKA